ncbi:hypothetical protein [Streptomyces sp. NRRL F-2580]|uniref:hypothetical protein n=1 Tax=Streptomyces sp. NRRL F-2580 TaxID=1463841 RepID=UPI00131A6C5D|nr:hypothetical protein [Streptomyces sp. NRRL F-2580]
MRTFDLGPSCPLAAAQRAAASCDRPQPVGSGTAERVRLAALRPLDAPNHPRG